MNKEIVIDGIKYVPISELKATETAKSVKGLTYCIIRTYSAGVWAGWTDLKVYGERMIIKDARRLWRWWSEFTLSALATTGIKPGKEAENKYAMPVESVYLTNVIEIIPCTETAKKQIVSQPNYSEKQGIFLGEKSARTKRTRIGYKRFSDFTPSTKSGSKKGC